MNQATNIVSIPVHNPKKRISVIMVTFHTGASLHEAIHAVLADKDILELIIIDNGNTPEARARLWEYCNISPRVRLVQGHGNIGFGPACNYGAKLSKGDYILFLNPDAIIEKGAAMDMANCGSELQCPWITGGFLNTVNGQEQRGSRRNKLTPFSAVISFTPLHKMPWFKSIHLEKTPFPEGPIEMPIVSGACMMMGRNGFEKLGGFNEKYFLHVEDIDVCNRAKKMGGDVYFVPSAKVMHYGSTSDARVQKVEYEKFKGFVRYFWCYSPKWWAKILLILTVPGMYLAIMGRAWVLALRAVWQGKRTH